MLLTKIFTTVLYMVIIPLHLQQYYTNLINSTFPTFVLNIPTLTMIFPVIKAEEITDVHVSAPHIQDANIIVLEHDSDDSDSDSENEGIYVLSDDGCDDAFDEYISECNKELFVETLAELDKLINPTHERVLELIDSKTSTCQLSIEQLQIVKGVIAHMKSLEEILGIRQEREETTSN